MGEPGPIYTVSIKYVMSYSIFDRIRCMFSLGNNLFVKVFLRPIAVVYTILNGIIILLAYHLIYNIIINYN